jgi:MFS family permease
MLVPFMPNVWLAITVLLMRFAISQMDVPARQSYVMHVVDPDERSAAAGVTGVARTLGASISPALAVPLMAGAAFIGAPFIIGGALKTIYDLVLYAQFRAHMRDGAV